jgi:hypothetical protein
MVFLTTRGRAPHWKSVALNKYAENGRPPWILWLAGDLQFSHVGLLNGLMLLAGLPNRSDSDKAPGFWRDTIGLAEAPRGLPWEFWRGMRHKSAKHNKMSLFPILGLIAFMFWGAAIPGLQSNGASKDPASSPEELVRAAEETYAHYLRGLERTREDEGGGEIRPWYWSDKIKSLKPARVYLHRLNLVVVQFLDDRFERGKYICLPRSAFLPTNGVDGFEFVLNDSQIRRSDSAAVLDYRKINAERSCR